MKVLYVAPEFPNRNEDAAQVRANHVLPLLSREVDLRVLGYGMPDGLMLFSLRDRTVIIKRWDSIFLRYLISFFSLQPRSFYRYNGIRARAAMANLMTSFRPDIVHLDSINSVVHMKCAKRANAKVVLHVHDSVTRLMYRLYNAQSNPFIRLECYIQYLKIKRAERTLYPSADICIVDSKSDADFLLNSIPNIRVNIVPLGFDSSIYKPDGESSDLGDHTLMFSGSMASAQSLEAVQFFLKEVMPLVWKIYPSTKLYLVGANPSNALRRVCAHEQRVIITGYVENLASYLRGATVYVCPLRLGSGMRTRVVEALATGCAVVSTKAGVEGLQTDPRMPTPWLVADSPSEFSKQILSLFVDGQRRRELGSRAAKFVFGNYSWEAVTKKILKIYESIL